MVELMAAALVIISVAGCGIAALPWTEGELADSVGAFRAAFGAARRLVAAPLRLRWEPREAGPVVAT